MELRRLAFIVVVAGAALVRADDEDWRKLRDRQPPIAGPVVMGEAAVLLTRPPGVLTDDTFTALHVALNAWLPLTAFPGGNTSAADCWGYTSASGREYAIIGLSKGYGFVEVTNPNAPAQVGFITAPTSLWHDVTVVGDWAYGASEGGGGVQVMDLRQIDAGAVTETAYTQVPGHSSTHTILSNPASGYLYLCGSNLGGLRVLSTADPANPTLVGTWSNGHYIHECLPVTYTSGTYAGKEIVFCFDGGHGLEILDATDKGNITLIGSVSYPGVSYCHQGWLTEDRQYMYIDDELDGQMSTRVIDVSNLSVPVFVTSFSNGTTSIDHNLYVKGNYVYASNYTTGLRVFDNTNPLAPVEVAFFDTRPESDAPTFNGDWGNYPYFPSGTVIMSDLERGLFVVTVDLGLGEPPPVPAAPSSLTGVESAPGVATLHWTDNASNEDRFDVERQQRVGTHWTGTQIVATPPANSTGHVESPGSGAFRYHVRAFNAGGTSAWTGYAVVRPALPTGLAASSIGAGQAKLTWADNSGLENGVTVQRQQRVGGSWTAKTMVGTAPSNATMFTDTPGAGLFRYRVRAFHNAGDSGFTGWASVTIP